MGNTYTLIYAIITSSKKRSIVMDMKKIGVFLAELRKDRNLTQDELGEKSA